MLIHPLERDAVPQATGDLHPGETLSVGALEIMPLHTPGHTAGMISLLVDGERRVHRRHAVQGLGRRRPRPRSHDLRRPQALDHADAADAAGGRPASIPGHTDPTTVADELEHNRFVRIWRGLDPEGSEHCTALGEPATLILLGDDYDGGHKAWVRWPDGSDDIVPGSRVSTG